jgi:hypothetical protein
VDVPRGFTSLARSGANPISPAAIVTRIAAMAESTPATPSVQSR